MRVAPIAVVVVATGCQAVFGLDDPLPRADAAIDAPPRLCWGTDIEVCLPEPATGAIVLSGPLDTTGSPMCVPSIVAFCAIAADRITIATALAVTGARPLVLIANDTIAIDGTLDVASHAEPRKSGPGVEAATCGPFVTAPSAQGGGAGGSFAGPGAKGGDNNDTPADTGGMPRDGGGGSRVPRRLRRAGRRRIPARRSGSAASVAVRCS